MTLSRSSLNDFLDKGEIVHVGEWDDLTNSPVGWVIKGARYGLQIFSDGREPLIAGYTVDELRAIYKERHS